MELPELTPGVIAFLVVEAILYLGGIVTFFVWQFGRNAEQRRELRLAPWNVPLSDFLLGALIVVVAGLSLQLALASLQRVLPDRLDADAWMIVQGAGFQFGLLLGAIVAIRLLRPRSTLPGGDPAPELTAVPVPPPAIGTLAGGFTLFLVALPLVLSVSLVWQWLLQTAGMELDQQEMIDLLRNNDSPFVIGGLAVLAVGVAPIAEEAIFRAGLFRYLRTRIPRPVALLLSSLVFASLHANAVAFAPLVALGILLCLAYERTGRIAIPMVAHALFNLHTMLLLLAGIDV